MTETISVTRDIWIEASLDKVWKALTEAEELQRWYTWDCEIDFSEGGSGKYNHGWGAWTSGTFTEIVEREKFVLTTEAGHRTITTLTPEGNGVKVSIEYCMPWMENEQQIEENMGFGTYQFMKNLKSILEEGTDLRPTFWKSWIGIKHTSIRPEPNNAASQGSKVLSVEYGTPAQEAGLTEGDVITAVNGKDIRSYEELESIITPSEVSRTLSLTVQRNGNKKRVQCETIPYPREYRTKVEW